MNRLEDQINRHRNALDSFEPPGGHMERFAGKLNLNRTTFLDSIPYAIKIAAVLLLVSASSILIYEQATQSGSSQSIAGLNELSPEYNDAAYYYTSLIEEKFEAINRFTSDNPQQNKLLMEELENMDRMFISLQEDLKANPTDERIIHAMIHHYELKLEVMGQILRHLENVEQMNPNNHEEMGI